MGGGIRSLLLVASHGIAVAAGFALGIYALPILTAPDAPSAAQIAAHTGEALYTGRFRRDLKDSDLLHWGEGTVSVGRNAISLTGRLAPGRITSCIYRPSSSKPSPTSRASSRAWCAWAT